MPTTTASDSEPRAPLQHRRVRGPYKKLARVASTAAQSMGKALTTTTSAGGYDSDADDLFEWPPGADAPSSPPSKALIVRSLRAEEVKLEAQFKSLLHKWRTSIADPSLLELACYAAKQRWITSKYEEEQRRLREQLLLQQLYLASVQVGLTESPLLRLHNSLLIFEAIHDPIHLNSSSSRTTDGERTERLIARSDVALKLAPVLVDKFTNSLVHRATPLLPYMMSTTTADREFTYLSTVSISKIELASVRQVFGAVLHYYGSLDAELGAHYNVRHVIKPIEDLGPMCNYSQLRYSSGSPFKSVSHTVFSASLTDDQGLVVIDFVDSDDRFAEVSRASTGDRERQRRDISVLLSITASVDPVSRNECVLVRHVRVYRYNLPPTSPTLFNEIKITQAYSNGDLFMAIVCQHLNESQEWTTTIANAIEDDA